MFPHIDPEMIWIVVGLVVIGYFFIKFSPHTSPGVDHFANGKATVHEGEQLVLRVPSGKHGSLYTFVYSNNKVVATGPFFNEERHLKKGSAIFKIGFLWEIKVTKKGKNALFEWPFGVYFSH